jgi:hypothetical protein
MRNILHAIAVSSLITTEYEQHQRTASVAMRCAAERSVAVGEGASEQW